MRIITLLPAASFLVLCSCNTQNNEAQYRALNESFKNSNKVVAEDNMMVYYELEGETHDMMTYTRARLWMPLVKNIQVHAQEMIDYIDALENKIYSKAIIIEHGERTLQEDNRKIPEEFFESSGKEQELFSRLEDYKKNILTDLDTVGFNNDPNMKEMLNSQRIEFSNRIPVFPGLVKAYETPASVRQKYLDENSLKNSTCLAAMMRLNKLKNDVLISEHLLMTWCKDQYTRHYGFTKFMAIAAIKSTYLKAGQENEVYAGVGSFDDASKPEITINKIRIPLEPEGAAVYKFKATGKPGKHTILVIIKYTDPNGNKQTVPKYIDYYIAE